MGSVLLVLAGTMGCGGASTGPAPNTPALEAATPRHGGAGATATANSTDSANGSSDGVTCEQAREQYVEEVDLQGGGAADLRADDFGRVLNHGAYLEPCDVPQSSHLRICAAVREGAAVGVTVALEPPAPETEVCVAKQVRGLTFPSHPKMDFVTVRF